MSGNPAAVRRATEAGRALARQGRLTRYALQVRLECSKPTAARWIARWRDDGLIREHGTVESGRCGPDLKRWIAAGKWE